MGIEQEILEAVSKYCDKHGELPGYLLVSDDKWEEILAWKPSGDLEMPGFFKDGMQVRKISFLPAGTIRPESHCIDPRTYTSRPTPTLPYEIRSRDHMEDMHRLRFGLSVLR